jgi:putative colanic acid biosynthesis acetyltransferase WcaF
MPDNIAREASVKVDVSCCPSPFSLGNKLARGLWGVVWVLLFRLCPRPLHCWRRFLLRLFGGTVGRGVHLYPSCKITMPWKLSMGDHSCLGDGVICYNVGGVKIGAHSTVSQYSHLCSSSHDYTRRDMPQTFAAIVIEDQVWVCADAFVAPGVTVGQGAVVGARAVVTKDVEPWTVVAGNPARFVKKRELKEN